MTDKLYVGIDVSGNSLVVGLVDATGKKIAAACEYRNNHLGTEKLAADLVDEVNKTGAEQLHLCYRSDWILRLACCWIPLRERGTRWLWCKNLSAQPKIGQSI